MKLEWAHRDVDRLISLERRECDIFEFIRQISGNEGSRLAGVISSNNSMVDFARDSMFHDARFTTPKIGHLTFSKKRILTINRRVSYLGYSVILVKMNR